MGTAILLNNPSFAQPPDILWTKTYGGSYADDWGRSVAQTSDGGYVITGYTASYGPDSSNGYLIKTDAKGDTLWTEIYDDCAGSSVAQTSDGGYIIAGSTWSDERNMNVYLIRLGPETGMCENSNLTAEGPNLRLGQNPFSTTTTISYQIPARSEVSLIVYDVTGREISRLVDGVQERGEYHLQLDMSDSPRGVYFIRMETSEFKATRKIILFR